MPNVHSHMLFGGSVTPRSLPNLAVWYDFSDVATLFQDAARTTPITTDAQEILGMADKSGNAVHLTSSASQGATYKTNIQNGKSIGRFDGSNDSLNNASLLGGTITETIFVVIKKTAAGGYRQVVQTNKNVLYASMSTNEWGVYQGNDWGTGYDPLNVFNTLVVRSTAVNDIDLITNGIVTPVSEGTGNRNTTSLAIGRDPANVQFFAGDVCEVIIYTRTLSDSETNAIGRYLAAKWGLTWYPVFEPTSVSGLVAWYDFANPSSLWKDTGRTIKASQDGEVILGVTDKSGTGNHLSEATNGPTYKAAIQNNWPIARFDGTNDLLSSANITLPAASTIFFVNKPGPSGGNNPYLSYGTGPEMLYAPFGTTAYEYIDLTSFNGITTNVNHGASGGILVAKYTSLSLLDFYSNGGAVAGTGNPDDRYASAAPLRLSAATGGSEFGPQDVWEVLVYNSALSAANINLVGQYLAAKWNKTWTTVT